MNTNPAEKPTLRLHEIKFTDEQTMMMWQLTEVAKPNNGSSADLLTSLRNRLRPAMARIRKAAEAAAANGQREPEMVRSGRDS